MAVTREFHKKVELSALLRTGIIDFLHVVFRACAQNLTRDKSIGNVHTGIIAVSYTHLTLPTNREV